MGKETNSGEKISVIVPCYNEEAAIPYFWDKKHLI